MDLDSHYEDLEKCKQRADKIAEKKLQSDLTVEANQYLRDLLRDSERLIKCYKSMPPKNYKRISIGDREVIAWFLSSGIRSDLDSSEFIYLLADGQLAIMLAENREYEETECVFDDRLGYWKHVVVGGGVTTGEEKFSEFFSCDEVDSYDDLPICMYTLKGACAELSFLLSKAKEDSENAKREILERKRLAEKRREKEQLRKPLSTSKRISLGLENGLISSIAWGSLLAIFGVLLHYALEDYPESILLLEINKCKFEILILVMLVAFFYSFWQGFKIRYPYQLSERR